MIKDDRIKIKKGESFPLSRGTVNLKKVRVCLGWETPPDVVYDLDLSCILLDKSGKCRDIHDFVCYASLLKRVKVEDDGSLPRRVKVGDDGKGKKIVSTTMRREDGFKLDFPVYEYFSRCLSVVHMGDTIGGKGKDDEQILVDLQRIPEEIKRLLFVVTIYQYEQRKNPNGRDGQSFSDCKGTYIRIRDEGPRTKAYREVTPEDDPEELHRYFISEDNIAKNSTAYILGEMTCGSDRRWSFAGINAGLKDVSIGDLIAYACNIGFSDTLPAKGIREVLKEQKINSEEFLDSLSKSNFEEIP